MKGVMSKSILKYRLNVLYFNLLKKFKVKYVSTSTNNQENNAASGTVVQKQNAPKQLKTWLSYGYDYEDETLDRMYAHRNIFAGVTIMIVLGCYILIHYPDSRLRQWSTREAYLELNRREKLGLPPIDCNLIDPKIVEETLPSEEELEGVELII